MIVEAAMEPAGNLRRSKIIVRAGAAMLLTGVVAALFVATSTAVFFSLSKPTTAMAFVEFVTIVWFFGSFIALGCAVLLGLFVEWPKIKWLKSDAISSHLLISIAGAETLLLSWATISQATVPTSPAHQDAMNGFLFVAFAAAIGGACSATFWWKLVAKPMR